MIHPLVRSICLALLLSSCALGPVVQPGPPPPTPPTSVAPTATPHPTASVIPATATVPSTLETPLKRRLTLDLLQNAAFHSPDWGDYQLVDGIFYRPPPAPEEAPQLYASQLFLSTFGDLNADGNEDAAVILQTKNGGNGDTKELAVVLDQDGKAVNVSTIYIGSMIAVEAVTIQAGIITLKMRVHGPDDGLCCPSQPETWQLRLENSQLTRLP